MKFDKVKIEKLRKEERKLLLKALGIPIEDLHCCYCNTKVSYESCCIMPSLNDMEKARIVCDSPLCVSNYLSDFEEDTDSQSNSKQKEKGK